MRRQLRVSLITLLAVLAACVAVNAQTAHAGWDWRQPAQQPATPQTVTEVGPYFEYRWDFLGDPIICFDNHSSRAMQTAVEQWDAQADDGWFIYEGTGNCNGFENDERVDIYDGYQQGCNYTYATLKPGTTKIARMILYLSDAAGADQSCWATQIRRNHYASSGVGLALGNESIYDYPPNGVFVMRAASYDSVSWAQPNDGNTFDFYN
jgi:hypothetical protein